MKDLFITFINMSLTASLAIIVVIALRLLLKKLPKIYSYLLWVVVFFRLVCPLALELPKAPVKPINIEKVIERQIGVVPELETSSVSQDEVIIEHSDITARETTNAQDIYSILSYIWVVGATAMVTWGIYSSVNIRSQLKESRKEEGYYTHTGIENSFIFGLVKPKIYIPSSVDVSDRNLILKHEQTHLRRGDHIFKILVYLVLCLHWFNPLVWVSFKLFEQDMEMSCDEKVTSQMNKESRALYAEALLKASAKPIVAFTACFGESGTKRRIVNMLRFKKPTKTIAVVCATLVFLTSCALGINEMSEEADESSTDSIIQETTIESTHEITSTGGGDCDVVGTEDVEMLTPPLGNTISNGTYNCTINMYDINETERLEINTWDYFEMSTSDVYALQYGDLIDARMTVCGEEITVDSINVLTDDDFHCSRYGYEYDEIIEIREDYYLWHLEGTDIWRLFGNSDTPIAIDRVLTCMPLSNDLIIYDQAGYFLDGGDVSDNCYVENTFANTFFRNSITQYAYNTITIENGEIISVTIYMHP